ncbi:hypothetical protein BT69DRAFT_681654 [Atractiella rhizophila]|nr:hypothetical protein BT69DRAFT_681654 [Atractiella rhizophila]
MGRRRKRSISAWAFLNAIMASDVREKLKAAKEHPKPFMPSAAQSAQSHPSTTTNGASAPPSAALPSAPLAAAPPSTSSPKPIPRPPTRPQTSTLPQSGHPTPSLSQSTLHLPIASSNAAPTNTAVNGVAVKPPPSISLAGLRAPPSIFKNASGAPSINLQNPSESIPKLEALLATAEKGSEGWKNVEKMLSQMRLALAQQQQRQRMAQAAAQAQAQAQAQQARMAGTPGGVGVNTAGGAGGGANRSLQASLAALQSSNPALAAQLASNPQQLAALQDRSNRQHQIGTVINAFRASNPQVFSQMMTQANGDMTALWRLVSQHQMRVMRQNAANAAAAGGAGGGSTPGPGPGPAGMGGITVGQQSVQNLLRAQLHQQQHQQQQQGRMGMGNGMGGQMGGFFRPPN